MTIEVKVNLDGQQRAASLIRRYCTWSVVNTEMWMAQSSG